MTNSRLTRLQNDYSEILELNNRNGLIYLIVAEGDPPERYVVGFRCRGVAEIDADDHPIFSEDHRVELVLTIDYPGTRPLALWKTPIFHPNFVNGAVCWEWYPQQSLCETCKVFAEMVQYKNYNSASPLDMSAAIWAMRHRDEMPMDPRGLFDVPASRPLKNEVSKTIYSPSGVVRGFVPIQMPTALISPATSTTLATFCAHCGFKFGDTDARFCPQCGWKRQIMMMLS